MKSQGGRTPFAHLLLLHELRVRAVVHDVLAEDGPGEWVVYLLGVDILDLAVQDEVISRRVQANCGLLPEEDECEDVAILPCISTRDPRARQ